MPIWIGIGIRISIGKIFTSVLGIKRIRKMVLFHVYFEVQTLSDAMNVVKQSLMLPLVMQDCAKGEMPSTCDIGEAKY